MTNRICSVGDCGRAVGQKSARGLCRLHYDRLLRLGSTDLPPKMKDRACSVEDCESPARKRGWCAGHYQQSRRTGRDPVPFQYKWADTGQPCVVCGDPVPEGSGRRKHCSGACQVADSATKGQRAAEFMCRLCGETVSLRDRDENGRLLRTDVVWCRRCGRESPEAIRYRRYGVTPQEYDAAVERGCPICKRTGVDLHVDHDHTCCPARTSTTCGKCVRGLICGPCNRALGMFRDSVATLRSAIEYLNSVQP